MVIYAAVRVKFLIHAVPQSDYDRESHGVMMCQGIKRVPSDTLLETPRTCPPPDPEMAVTGTNRDRRFYSLPASRRSPTSLLSGPVRRRGIGRIFTIPSHIMPHRGDGHSFPVPWEYGITEVRCILSVLVFGRLRSFTSGLKQALRACCEFLRST